MRNTYSQLEARRQEAVQELISMVSSHYPSAQFLIEPGIDDPEATYIVATVDVDDPDEVMDLVIDRMLALQIDEGLSVHLIPIRTPEQTKALLPRRRERPEALLRSRQV